MKLTKRKNRAFTLIELLVAMGIFVIVISFSGQIFKVCIESHRIALANAEIMQKFRAITNQLDSDFRGLDKDGEIFVVWDANVLKENNGLYISDERFDRIMFFAQGDFQSYGKNIIRGNAARICYTLGKKGQVRPKQQKKSDRMLARTQHILTYDAKLPGIADPNNFTPEKWKAWNDNSQYDRMSIEQWKRLDAQVKADILSIICDIDINIGSIKSRADKDLMGISINPDDPNTLHMLLCEGVGEFKIQGWDNTNQRWMPEVDPDGNRNLSDTNFYLTDTNKLPGVLYPWPFATVGEFPMKNVTYPLGNINRENFNSIPGLGRAFKFTFTLFDSKGIIKGGRTFTYIVNLDK